jgi:hypothetical protein
LKLSKGVCRKDAVTEEEVWIERVGIISVWRRRAIIRRTCGEMKALLSDFTLCRRRRVLLVLDVKSRHEMEVEGRERAR